MIDHSLKKIHLDNMPTDVLKNLITLAAKDNLAADREWLKEAINELAKREKEQNA